MGYKKYILLLLFILCLSLCYYFFNIDLEIQTGNLLTISTFLFAIFTGFFIYQQYERYANLRHALAEMDGEVTNIFRMSGHFGEKFKKKIGEHFKKKYKEIVDSKTWNVYIKNKSNVISFVHDAIEPFSKQGQLPTIVSMASDRIFDSLRELQRNRKLQIALELETMPFFHWLILYILATVLLVTLSLSFNTQFNLFFSILKAIFASSVFLVLFLLKHLENLDFFEVNLGEGTAKDFLDIFANKK
jgi:hypothetical protein